MPTVGHAGERLGHPRRAAGTSRRCGESRAASSASSVAGFLSMSAMTPPPASVDSRVHNLRSEPSAADWSSAVHVCFVIVPGCRLCDPRVRICRRRCQTVTTVTTVGSTRSPAVHGGHVLHDHADPHGCGKSRAVPVGVLLEGLIRGTSTSSSERRRIERRIGRMTVDFRDRGCGHVDRASVLYLRRAREAGRRRRPSPARLQGVDYPTVLGDIADDSILEPRHRRAHALIAALDLDADNVFVTLSSRALRPDRHHRPCRHGRKESKAKSSGRR